MLLDFYLTGLGVIALFSVVMLLGGSRELLHRILTLVVILHVLVLSLITPSAFALLVLAIFLLAGEELRARYGIPRGYFFSFALPAVLLAYRLQAYTSLNTALFLAVSLSLFVLGTAVVRRKGFALLFVYAFLAVAAVALLALRQQSPAPVICLLLLLQINDATGYVVGKRFGRRKCFPRISPNKSLEGYLAGAAGTALGVVLLNTAVPVLGGSPLWKDCLIAAFVIVAGNAGDLLLSAYKRKLAIKDFSAILPGHGGVLDRFDNTLFSAPLFLLLWSALFS